MKNVNRVITISVLISVSLLGANVNVPNINSSTIERQIQIPKDIPNYDKKDIG